MQGWRRQAFKDEESVKFLQDATVTSKFSNAKKLSDVNVADYDAIFYVGGHGPVIDLASDPVNIDLASKVGVTGRYRAIVDKSAGWIVLGCKQDCVCSVSWTCVRQH